MKQDSKNTYYFTDNGKVGHCIVSTKIEFVFDSVDYERIKSRIWYSCKNHKMNSIYIADKNGNTLHRFILNADKGYEVDHIDLDTLNNRRNNLRVCTHQQNQCNQPLQQNNKSGVSGVSYYKARQKYRARIKISQQDVHLGYYSSFLEAIQARNEGIKLMFGEYGRINEVPPAPVWIKNQVYNICSRFSDKAAVSFS